MTEEDFKWLVEKLDNPQSVVNDPALDLLRELLVKDLASYDPSKKWHQVDS